MAVDFLERIFDVDNGDERKDIKALVSDLEYGTSVVVNAGDVRYWAGFDKVEDERIVLGGPGDFPQVLMTYSNGGNGRSSSFKKIEFGAIRSIYRLL